MELLSNKQVHRLEFLWWLLSLLLAFLVLLPILLYVENYPFWGMNILFILTFITTTRYIFLLPFTFLARRFWLKFILIFISIPFVFFLIQELVGFQTFLDEQGIDAIVGLLPFEQRQSMIHYIRSEFLLFGIGAITGAVVFPFRLMVSIWRFRNRGTI